MGVSTTLQLEPGAAVQGLALQEGGSAQRRRWRGNRQGCLAPKEREVGAQAGELAQPRGKGQQPCPGGGQQSLRAQPPLAGGAPWDTQRLSCPQGVKKRRCRQAVSKGAFPSFNPLATTQQKSSRRGSCRVGCPCRVHPLHHRAGHALCPALWPQGQGCRAAPTASPTLLPDNPTYPLAARGQKCQQLRIFFPAQAKSAPLGSRIQWGPYTVGSYTT